MSNPDSASPRRYIYDDADLKKFLSSPCKSELLRLVSAQGKACASSSFRYDPQAPLLGISPAMACLHGALEALFEWVEDFPPVQNSHIVRFGNPAFKEWHKRLTERSSFIVSAILKTAKEYSGSEDFGQTVLEEAARAGKQAAERTGSDPAVVNDGTVNPEILAELTCYLHDAFGHAIRLDYGTGHESSFEVFLFVLCKLHCFGSTPEHPPTLNRLKATTLSIYQQYLKVTRRLQTDYMLEPAGSHGVWGLDDYHCLPFYFGACQLQAEEDSFTPSSIHDDSILRSEGDTFVYFGCIRYIKELKKGVPFFESSPMLNDISQLTSWSKVASGLLKLYEGEVLKKRQVVQHFRFGKIFAANWTPSQQHPQEAPTAAFRVDKQETKMTMSPTKAPWAK